MWFSLHRKNPLKGGHIGLAFTLVLAIFLFSVWHEGCRNREGDRTTMNTSQHLEPIDSVKARHVDELMSIPGVVGVYIGELPDHTPCLGVMVAEKTEDLEKRIPSVIEGYRVRIDVTGRLKPM